MKFQALKRTVSVVALGVLAAGALYGCGQDGASTSPTATVGGSSGGTQSGAQEINIVAKDNLFEPKTYTAEAGKPIRITATNSGQNVHEVEVKGLLPETKLSPGQNKSIDLQSAQPGTYKVYCEIHEDEGMEGELVVK
ncbi:MAG TPA: cupredoxin domain-containing protein [Chloroflexia bacterium]